MKNYDQKEIDKVNQGVNEPEQNPEYDNINEYDVNNNNEDEIDYNPDEYMFDNDEFGAGEQVVDPKLEWKNITFGKYKFKNQNVTWEQAKEWLENPENLKTNDLDTKFSYIITWLMPSDSEIANNAGKPVVLDQKQLQYLEATTNQTDDDASKRYLFQMTEYLVNFVSFDASRDVLRRGLFPQLCENQPNEEELTELYLKIDDELSSQYSEWSKVNENKKQAELLNEKKKEEEQKKLEEQAKQDEQNAINNIEDNKSDVVVNDAQQVNQNNEKKIEIIRYVEHNGKTIQLNFHQEFTVDDLLENDEQDYPEVLSLLCPNALVKEKVKMQGETKYGISYKPVQKNKSAKELTLGDIKILGKYDELLSDDYLVEKAYEIKYGKDYVKDQIDKAGSYFDEREAFDSLVYKRSTSYNDFLQHVRDNGNAEILNKDSAYGYSRIAKIIAKKELVGEKDFDFNPDYREKLGMDWDAKKEEDNWSNRSKEFKNRVEELENDYDFKLYLTEITSNKKILQMSEEDFIKGWTDHKQKMQNIYNNIKKDPNEYITLSGRDEKVVFMQDIDRKIENIKRKNEPYSNDSIVDAVDDIIDHTLKTKAAQVSFFARVAKKNVSEDGVNSEEMLDRKKTNAFISDMRETLINDPVFRSVFLKRVPKRNFYREYCSAISREINKDIRDENEIKKSVSKEQKAEMQSLMKEGIYPVGADKARVIHEVFEDLTEFNKGKNPSKYMENLMDSLEEVVKDIDDSTLGVVNMDKLDKLNKAALKYYDKRQGIVFSPLTDDGQSRLAAVARLVRVTNSAVKDMRNVLKQQNNGPAMHN